MDALRRVRMGLLADAAAHAKRGVLPVVWAERVLKDPGVRKLYLEHATPERLAREVRAILGLVYGM